MHSLSLRHLSLRDYRCFDALEVDFHERLTVLVAANGAGKTSVLDAVAVAIGPYVGAFDEGIGRHFEADDIRQRRVRETGSNEMEHAALGVWLEARGRIPGGLADDPSDGLSTWQRRLAGPSKTKTTIREARELIAYGKRLQMAVRTPGEQVVLPLLAYYGTGRLWQQKKLTVGKLPRTSRTVGYSDCLDPASSYKSFVEWFRYWTTNALQQRLAAGEAGHTAHATEFDAYLASVGGAVDTCLAATGWTKIGYSLSREALTAQHAVHGELLVDLLSDGIRNMIGMVADMAFRATKLNPQLGASAALETPGIVLIDEVDMHLHPEWQQVVLQNLLDAFPRVQWIVTTHSPQVLSTVRRENIRVLGWTPERGYRAEPPLMATYGEPSGAVMHAVMEVDPQPPVPEKSDLQALTSLVDQGAYEAAPAVALFERLNETLGPGHPQMQRLQRSMRRQQALKK